MLLGRNRLLSELTKAAQQSKADETLVAARRGEQTTLRFSGGQIYQNFHEEAVTVWIKVACGTQVGVATTSSLTLGALLKAVDSAISIARLSGKQASPAFRTSAAPEPTPTLTTHFPSTAQGNIPEVIRTIRRLSSSAKKKKCDLAGSFVIAQQELAVVGSRGLAQYQPFSVAGMRLVATRNKASGFAAQTVRDLSSLNPDALLKRALDHCQMNRNPKEIRLGKYDVLLEPEAVSELVEWLAYIGLGAKQMSERTSFMAGRMGDRLMDKKISITDDGTDPEGLAVPFDFEGILRQRVSLIRKGVAEGIVYDSQYGKLYRHPSTGHAPAYTDDEGPLPANLFVEGGQTPYEELLPSMDHGLWISRFHYVNGLLNTQEALMTGLTRDGTFLVRKGRVVGAVKNLRFTQSILEAFSSVAAVSRQRRLIADPGQGFFSVVTPALLIKNFSFTGQTR